MGAVCAERRTYGSARGLRKPVLARGQGGALLLTAFKGHDPAQRATGMLCLFGGILIAFSKEIIEVIAGVTI